MSDFPWLIPDASLVSTTIATVEQIDHVASALARLPQQWVDKANTIALLTIFAARFNDLEQAYQDLLLKTGLATSFGATVDQLGKLVGQTRQGNGDPTYQKYIGARILADNSDGTMEDIIAIVRAVLGDALGQVIYRTVGNASFMVEVQGRVVDATTAGVVQQMLIEGVSGGVRWIFVYSTVPLAQTFRFDTGPGFDVGHFATAVD